MAVQKSNQKSQNDCTYYIIDNQLMEEAELRQEEDRVDKQIHNCDDDKEFEDEELEWGCTMSKTMSKTTATTKKKTNNYTTTSSNTPIGINATSRLDADKTIYKLVEAICMKCAQTQDITVNKTTADFYQGQRKEVLAEECSKCKTQLWLVIFPSKQPSKMDAMFRAINE